MGRQNGNTAVQSRRSCQFYYFGMARPLFLSEYIGRKSADSNLHLWTGDVNLDPQAGQIQLLSEALMDSSVLALFESRGDEDKG